MLASSSEVYGDPRVSPQHESYWGHVNPVGPRSVYDEAKRYAEALTTAYRHSHALDARIVRIFNTYGPRMRVDDGRALAAFFTQAIRGEPVTVYGDGSQTRSFCYVDDLVEGIWRVLRLKHDFGVESADGGPRVSEQSPHEPGVEPIFNLGNSEEVTILQLAREIIQLTKSDSEIVFEPVPVDDPKTRRPDLSRAKDVLRWEPLVMRSDGLQKVLLYFRRVMDVAL